MDRESVLLQFYNTPLSDEINKLVHPLTDCFQIDTFAYASIDNDGALFQISNKPHLAEVYFSEKFYKKNPLFRHPDLYDKSLCFLSSEIIDPHFQKAHDDYSDRTGFNNSIWLIQKGEGGISIFLFSSSVDDLAVLTAFTKYQSALEKYSEYFLDKWKKNTLMMDSFSLQGPEVIGTCFSNSKLQLKDRIDRDKLVEFGLKVGMIDRKVTFTRREKECITLFLSGKTAKEIGEALYISVRTVEQHLETIKQKLGCTKKSETFEKLAMYQSLHLL